MTEWLAQPVDGEFVVMMIAVIGAFILGGVLVHYLRRPDDPGVDDLDEPLRWYERPFSYGLIWSLVAIEAAAIVALLLFVGALG